MDFQIHSDLTLNSLINGKNGVVVVFIPNIHSITTEIQLKNLNIYYKKIKKLGWELIGIINEEMSEVKKIFSELSIPFKLVTDPSGLIAEEFNVVGNKPDRAHVRDQSLRRTFIVNSKFEIIKKISKISPGPHAEQILNCLVQFDSSQISKSSNLGREQLS